MIHPEVNLANLLDILLKKDFEIDRSLAEPGMAVVFDEGPAIHFGFVHEINEKGIRVDSKWGLLARLRHPIDTTPYGGRGKLYRFVGELDS